MKTSAKSCHICRSISGFIAWKLRPSSKKKKDILVWNAKYDKLLAKLTFPPSSCKNHLSNKTFFSLRQNRGFLSPSLPSLISQHFLLFWSGPKKEGFSGEVRRFAKIDGFNFGDSVRFPSLEEYFFIPKKDTFSFFFWPPISKILFWSAQMDLTPQGDLRLTFKHNSCHNGIRK